MNNIRILIAEDSTLFVTVLREMIAPEPDLEVVGVASDGQAAVAQCAAKAPDLVLMDIHMPKMDGLTATGQIMARCPTPILVITAEPCRGGVDLSFKALSAGALELVGKPDELPMREAERIELLRKIRILAEVPVVRHVRQSLAKSGHPVDASPVEANSGGAKSGGAKSGGAKSAESGGSEPDQPQRAPAERRSDQTPVVGIVASTGGPRALARLLGGLDAEFGAPIVVVQHITRGFSAHLSRWLDAHCAVGVVEARHGQPVRAGQVYIAPTEMQMEVTAGRYLKVYDGPAVAGHRPSGDVLLRSLARQVAPRAAGLVLSGMGRDGALGMAALYRSGCPTLVQDEASAVVYSMPRAAVERGVVSGVVELDALAARLTDIVADLTQDTGS